MRGSPKVRDLYLFHPAGAKRLVLTTAAYGTPPFARHQRLQLLRSISRRVICQPYRKPHQKPVWIS